MKTTTSPISQARISNLQILRFVAAFGVLLSHAADLTLSAASPILVFPWTAGVDIFFVISGIIMTILTDGRFGQRGAARAFLARRIIRIAPIYWLFTGLMIATVALIPGEVRNTTADPASIVTSLAFIPHARGDGQVVPILAQGWTLNYEAFFYASFAFALLFRRGLVLLAAALVAFALLHSIIAPSIVPPHFWSEPVIVEFVAGIGLGKMWLRGARLRAWAIAGLAVLSLLLFGLAEPLGWPQQGREVARGIPAVLLCAAFLFAPEPENAGRLRRALIAAGDASYALYLSHTFTINAVVLAVGPRLPGGVTMSAAIVIAVAVSLMVHRLIERPMLQALHHSFGTRSTG